MTGETYDVVERSVGCSYEDIVANLEDRYGQPATVAEPCYAFDVPCEANHARSVKNEKGVGSTP